jgi:uncharacterized membrane protein
MRFAEAIELVGKCVDAVGVAIVVVGVGAALIGYVVAIARSEAAAAYPRARQGIGRAILLGLEFLVAGDIIRTVAVSPSFTSVGILALIVLVRTFLSFSLEVELRGRVPWRDRTSEQQDADDG